MSMKQQMKQSLGMTMTPQLQQAIKILQMSVVELQQEVNQALIDNPTLEEVSSDEAPSPEVDREKGVGDETTEFNAYQELDPSALGPSQYKSTRNFQGSEFPNHEQVLSKPDTLHNHVLWQYRLSVSDERELQIGEAVIGNINDDGYLVCHLEEIQAQLKEEEIECDEADLEAVLFKIQRFDPPGVGARNLQECLLIQAENWDEDDEVEIVIKNHLPELETKNYT